VGVGPGTVEGLGMTPQFWRGRRVFITGHTGFKGAWLALWLHRLGAEVTGYALAPAADSVFSRARVADLVCHVAGDVRDGAALAAAMRRAQPEIVLHLAAQALVRESYRQPVETYAVNVMGTVHLLDAIRETPSVRGVIVVTSDKCYENREWDWGYRESDRLGGRDPYSNSKGCAELVTAAWRGSFFAGARAPLVATARAGNVIGGGDICADRLVPDALAAFARGTPLELRYPDAVRPWQFVLEPLRGYLMLAERLHRGDATCATGWNFGPAEADCRPVREVAERLAALWGPGASVKRASAPADHEATFLRLDCARAHTLLGWRPRVPLERGLAMTVDWQRAAARGDDMRACSLAQIDAYAGAARPLVQPAKELEWTTQSA
jgi:CDP-glucose 4,6-dehydratase